MRYVQFSIRSSDGVSSFNIDEETIVGRDPSCGACIADKSLSRQHARLYLDGKKLYVEDLKSTNGTFVNGERLGEEAIPLRYNDVISFDQIEFKIFVELTSQTTGSDEQSGEPISGEKLATVEPLPTSLTPEKTPEADVQGATTEKTTEEVVVQASATVQKSAPGSWAVVEDASHGTVIMDLNEPQDVSPEHTENRISIEEALVKKVEQPSLIALEGIEAGKTIALIPEETGRTVWNMGRRSDMNIRINDPSVSEHQAQIIHEQKAWKLVDVISTNATYVNEDKILTHYLSNGDVLALGPVRYMFRLTSAARYRVAADSSSGIGADAAAQSSTVGENSGRYLKIWGIGAAVILVALVLVSSFM